MFREPLAQRVPEGIELFLRSPFGGGAEGPEQLILVRALRLSRRPFAARLTLATPDSAYLPVGDRLGLVLYDVIHTVLPPVLRAVWRPTVRGLEHVPAQRRGDPGQQPPELRRLGGHPERGAAQGGLPRQVRLLHRHRRASGLASRVWFEGLGMLPVDRDDTKAAIASLDIALDVLGRGEAFGIYPEGTRSRDGRLYRGRTGVAHLALTAGVPVVPVGLTGTQNVQPVGSSRPRVVPITVAFGEPIDFAGRFDGVPSGRARREATDEVMAAIQRLTGQEEAGVYNERPID